MTFRWDWIRLYLVLQEAHRPIYLLFLLRVEGSSQPDQIWYTRGASKITGIELVLHQFPAYPDALVFKYLFRNGLRGKSEICRSLPFFLPIVLYLSVRTIYVKLCIHR